MDEALLTTAEAAAFLKTSNNAVYIMASRRVLPFYKVSRKIMFDRNDLINWQRRHRVSSSEELTGKAQLYCAFH